MRNNHIHSLRAAFKTGELFDAPRRADLIESVIAGLRKTPKEIPTAWLYDETGSELFEQICEAPEYYLTRSELAIMRAHAADMAQCIGAHAALIEFGSGSSLKTRALLDRVNASIYVPIDISCIQLLDAASAIARDYPSLAVTPLCGDFTKPLDLPSRVAKVERRVVYFPGSTIGNFELDAAQALLESIRELIGVRGAALIGVDLKKDPTTLLRAYDDADGITARFNLNVLRHLNRALDGDFRIEHFQHRAVWIDAKSRIEMRLVSRRDQNVRVAGEVFSIAEGEYMRTEYSHKYTLDSFAALAHAAGFAVRKRWCDEERMFSVQFLEPAGTRASIQ